MRKQHLGEIGVALVNGTADPGRRRFDLAHEFGHHLLADEYTADFGLGTTQADREALLNAFAIHFLMPRPSVRRRWRPLREELRPIALAPAYSQAAVRAFRRGVISADRAIELLRRTVTIDDLPRPDEMPIEALAPEFEDLG